MSRSAFVADITPVSPSEARQLFSHLKNVPAIVVGVSGGPDSTALLWLIARWRKSVQTGPKLLAVTVDHGLRPEAAKEALAVKRLAKSLGVAHRTLKWTGKKPRTGLQAAARETRYRLMSDAARHLGATHIATAHSRDDQAETVLMRMSRGSGIGGLAGMTRDTPLPSPSPRKRGEGRGEGHFTLTRPLLDIPKSRLVATLQVHDIPFADDSSNSDPRFTRVRWRGLMPSLSDEGLDARSLARLAKRAGRADAALELAALGAEQALVRDVAGKSHRLHVDRLAFTALPDEIRLRLLGRMISRAGSEGPVELGKLETMLEAVNDSLHSRGRLKRTLAGAVVAVGAAEITVERAPPRHVAPKARQKGPRKA